MENSTEAKKSKLSKLDYTLRPLETITHRQIRDLLDQTETLELKIPAGGGVSVFEVKKLEL